MTEEQKAKVRRELIAELHLHRTMEPKLNKLWELADSWHSDVMATRTADVDREEYREIVRQLVAFGRIF